MAPVSGKRIRLIVAVAIALMLLATLTWRLRPTDQPPTPPASAAQTPTVPTQPPGPVEQVSAPSSPAAAAAAASQSAPAGDSLRTIQENGAPGRILFLDFSLDSSGLRLVGATGAAGRAKPLGLRPGPGFIHYEVFDAVGQLTAEGSVEDPTQRRVEFPASAGDGRIASTIITNPSGTLAVRLPGESSPYRIRFYRDRNPVAPSPAGREPLGEFLLRPAP
jgi:hypothetical protein